MPVFCIQNIQIAILSLVNLEIFIFLETLQHEHILPLSPWFGAQKWVIIFPAMIFNTDKSTFCCLRFSPGLYGDVSASCPSADRSSED